MDKGCRDCKLQSRGVCHHPERTFYGIEHERFTGTCGMSGKNWDGKTKYLRDLHKTKLQKFFGFFFED